MRWTAVILAAMLAAACGADRGAVAPVAPAPAPEAPPPPRKPVVVAIVVDQLSAWVAATRLPELPPDGGFGRLVSEGTWAKTLLYSYAVTDTAPGHAALHTGKAPYESGIFANELPVPDGRRVSILRDPGTKLVTPDGPKDEAGASAARLRVDTVADRLRAAHPDALVVSVSLKDRGAIIPGGKHPTHTLWFDTGEGSFVTSSAFEKTFPSWAVPVGGRRAIDALMAVPWEPTDPAWLAARSGVKDDAPGEGDLDGLGRTFPHVAKTPNAFRATPASDRAVASLALAAVEAEWDPSRPTLLLLSFSASDVVGHVFGPDSWEAWDHLRRLDETLGDLFTRLEAKVGPFAAILSADHGDVPMPEASSSRKAHCACTSSERLSPLALGVELRAAAKAAAGAADLVAGVADPYVYLTPAARALPAYKRAALDRAVRATLAKHPGVAKVYDDRTLAASCPGALERGGDDLLALVCRSWPGPPDESGAGDYYVVPAPGSFFDSEITKGKGTSHGTPYAWDRAVPLLVRAPGRIDRGAVISEPIDFSAYAALESALLELEPASPKDIFSNARVVRE